MPVDGFVLDGHRIAFNVNIDVEGIDKDDPLHAKVIEKTHFNPSDYSLSRFFINLTSMPL